MPEILPVRGVRRARAEELIRAIEDRRARASKVVFPVFRRVGVVASGPSLEAWQTDYLAARGVTCIATNSSYRRLSSPGIVYGCDAVWWDHNASSVKFAGHTGWTQDHSASIRHGLRYVRAVWRRGLGRIPGVIHHGANSGFQAINLAYQFGAREIYLVGFDMQKTGGKSHWHGDHPEPLKNAGGIETWIKNFAPLAEGLRAEGVRVINCSIQTALTCFDRADLREVI